MKTLTEPIGYLETLILIAEKQHEIDIFRGLIKELKRINRPCNVHVKALNDVKREKAQLCLTLLN